MNSWFSLVLKLDAVLGAQTKTADNQDFSFQNEMRNEAREEIAESRSEPTVSGDF